MKNIATYSQIFLFICIAGILFITLGFSKSITVQTSQVESDLNAVSSSDAPLGFGTYTGTIAINEPLALGVLDISLTLTETNGTLTGKLNDEQALAFSDSPVLSGNIAATNSVTPTFTIASAPFGGVVSEREVKRQFTINGEIHEDGDVILGTYRETIEGFTPDALTVEGLFLASRPVALASAASGPISPNPTITPTPGIMPTPPTTDLGNKIFLPSIHN